MSRSPVQIHGQGEWPNATQLYRRQHHFKVITPSHYEIRHRSVCYRSSLPALCRLMSWTGAFHGVQKAFQPLTTEPFERYQWSITWTLSIQTLTRRANANSGLQTGHARMSATYKRIHAERRDLIHAQWSQPCGLWSSLANLETSDNSAILASRPCIHRYRMQEVRAIPLLFP